VGKGFKAHAESVAALVFGMTTLLGIAGENHLHYAGVAARGAAWVAT
jgi:hypothetical protein